MTSIFPNNKRQSISMQLMGDQKRRELRELFDTFDKDKDGKISHAEFQQVLAYAGVDAQSVMTIMKNKNQKGTASRKEGGAVFYSYEEFVKLFRPTLSTPVRRTAKEQELADAFRTFDRDGDGVITHEELRLTLQQLGEQVSEDEAKEIIAEVDEDQDGAVNFQEFMRMMGMAASSSTITNKKRKSEKRRHRFQDKLKRLFRR